ncbi:MAG: hypothetical protein A2V98_13775 [Planctomycetes bacterium RBG_16_64_12]|nr:MAG: hypothetical protein A2V98_13775 [Planctomycetes bacterium RBG_16_64_12]
MTKPVPVEVRVLVNYGGEFARDVPLAGATVSITRSGKTVAQGVTDKDGLYRVLAAPGSGYQLRVSPAPNQRLTSESRTFTVGQSYQAAVTLRPSKP